MLKHHPHILTNQQWAIGDRRQKWALDDHWVSQIGPLRPHLRQASDNNSLAWAQELIQTTTHGSSWDLNCLRECWPKNIVQKIVALLLGGPDLRCWLDKPVGSSSSTKSYTKACGVKFALAANFWSYPLHTNYSYSAGNCCKTGCQQGNDFQDGCIIFLASAHFAAKRMKQWSVYLHVALSLHLFGLSFLHFFQNQKTK